MKRSTTVSTLTLAVVAAMVFTVFASVALAFTWVFPEAFQSPVKPAMVQRKRPTPTPVAVGAPEPAPEVIEQPPELEQASFAAKYDTVAEYFVAGNPNATTYRLGEPIIKRKSYSRKHRKKIHRENGGCCQVCGSTDELEVEHRRGLQNGGGNERSNLGTLCRSPCHGEKTAMDNSLRRQREKLLAEKRD